ncbi:MAG: VWA domain-containing protein [Anaerolineae bacterium]|nr:VWA domain-containing protein [Anaerolineae bacterium]
MHRVRLSILIALLGVLSLAAPPVLADGIIIPEPPDWPEPVPLRDTWLTITYHHVDVTIRDQVATTRVVQEFRNEYEWEAEGTYLFPLPEGSAVSEFVMWSDGVQVEGRILDADEARRIYEDTVRNRHDPALLEYVGRSAVQARIFPIPPGGTRKIEIEYTQVLPFENGMVRYVYPLNTEKFSARPLESVSVRVEIHSQQAMKALYSPTHQDRVYITRESDYSAIISYEESDVLPRDDFDLVYTVGQDEVGLSLFSFRNEPDDGYFLLLIAPPVHVSDERVVPKDVLLVLDTSGSMDGEKIAQARDALVYVLEHLGSQDRFNVIAFSTGIQQYANEPRPVAETGEAAQWVRRLEAMGGTDINSALMEAMSQVDEARSAVVIFLTDGQPTEGVIEAGQILSNAAAAAPDNARLFAFGVGDDVNTTLLDTLAQQHSGDTGYVRPYERIDEEVSAFYARISSPVLMDIKLDFGDVVVSDIYPDPLPDLFAGDQLILTGRFRTASPGAQEVAIALKGNVNNEQQRFIYSGVFQGEGGEDFVPRLWATRKIGYLLTQIRLHGEKREWVDAVVALSLRHGVITEYTSFLIDEDVLSAAGREEAVEKFLALPEAPQVGASAVELADEQSEMRKSESAGSESVPVEAADVVQLVGEKTFILQNDVWIDTAFDSDSMEISELGFGSNAYFDLVRSMPELGRYLAVGPWVIFVDNGIAYEVVENDEIPEPGVQPAQTPSADPATDPSPVSTVASNASSGDDGRTTKPIVCNGAVIMAAVSLLCAAVWQRWP